MVKELLKSAARTAGYELFRLDRPGGDPLRDIAAFTRSTKPLIFDVGANVGQSATQFRALFPSASIHCFEPGRSTFQTLARTVAGDRNISAWNCGFGAEVTEKQFFENEESVMSSFLPLGADAWAKNVTTTTMHIDTVDNFCGTREIENIDLLKSDTQGYDLEVLKGAERMLSSGAIKLVYLELNFAKIYAGQASPGRIYDFLIDRGFRLFSLYQIFRKNEFAAWTDALFVSRSQCLWTQNGSRNHGDA